MKKLLKIFVIVSLVSMLIGVAAARDYNYHPELTVVKVDSSFKSAMATSNAMGGHQFSYGIHGWQGSFSLGGYDNEVKPSVALAKRYKGILYNTAIGDKSFNATVNWTF